MKKKILLLSIGIYIISLTQKSYCTSGGTCEYFSGLLNLIFGWIGVFKFHLPAFPWIANLILLISWKTFYKNTNISFILSILTFLTMLSFLFVDQIIVNDGSTKSKVIFYGFGYWMWLVSSFIMLIGNIIIYKKKRN
ncbi:hypothetical protein KO506_17020 [Polaribacter vadi]|uniref:hypothetical protein n=1 Tax=Polaribacter TaxID=52959 RepID=UPI001C09C5D8|nr:MULTISPECIES: hypothetical protein [Polaribacter]MBU3013117.1 hypothetical protein [Polaribacter vadi]MDO6742937.1 hypothetical protein [Polaribacter sp. 1_MG-2023]